MSNDSQYILHSKNGTQPEATLALFYDGEGIQTIIEGVPGDIYMLFGQMIRSLNEANPKVFDVNFLTKTVDLALLDSKFLEHFIGAKERYKKAHTE